MPNLICAIDQGTTGTTVILVDEKLNIVARVNQEFPQIYPQAGWVEHGPDAIWKSTLDTIARATQHANAKPADIIGVGITNQRETTVVWDRKTKIPIYNAIVWQDRRTSNTIENLRNQGLEEAIQKKTGLILDPYFSGTKISWVLDKVDGARARATRGELAFGTIDSFLLFRLTGEHKTDVSNASRTLLMDLKTTQWDEDLLKTFRVPESMLPEILGNTDHFGNIKGVEGLLDGTPVCGIAGDQQSALFGQACFEPGSAKCTFGTGAFLLMNTGENIVISKNRLLTTAAWKLNGKMTYALEGSAFIAGAMVQWLRDGLGFFESSHEIEALANEVESSDGVFAVPSLAGLGAPHWNPEARGVLWGMTRGTTRAHIARAVLEGIALQNVDILNAMEKDFGKPLIELKVDGGASENNLLMQMQSNFLNTTIVRPAMTDTTGLGAALFAGLSIGIFSDLDDVRKIWSENARFESQITPAARDTYLRGWAEAIRRV